MNSYQKYQVRYSKLETLNEESRDDCSNSQKRKKVSNNLKVNSEKIKSRPNNLLLNSPIIPKKLKTDFITKVGDFNASSKNKDFNVINIKSNLFDNIFDKEKQNNTFCSFCEPKNNIDIQQPTIINNTNKLSLFNDNCQIKFGLDKNFFNQNNNLKYMKNRGSKKINNSFLPDNSILINTFSKNDDNCIANNNRVNNNASFILPANNIIKDCVNNNKGNKSPSFLPVNNIYEYCVNNDNNNNDSRNKTPCFLYSNNILEDGNNNININRGNRNPFFFHSNNNFMDYTNNNNRGNKSLSFLPGNSISEIPNSNMHGFQDERNSKMNNNINFLQKKNSYSIAEINRAVNYFNNPNANNSFNPFNPNNVEFNIINSKPILNNSRNNRITTFSDNIFQSNSSLSETEKSNGLESHDLSSVSSDNNFFGEKVPKVKKTLCKYCNKLFNSSNYFCHLSNKHMEHLTKNELFDCFNVIYKCTCKNINKIKEAYSFLERKKVAGIEKKDNKDYKDIAKKMKLINSFKPFKE